MINLKKSFLFIGIAILISVSVYCYQFPIKKYIAKQSLYELLYKNYDLNKEQIHIKNTVRDINSHRQEISIFFTVDDSSLNYIYDYFPKENKWTKGYIKDGVTVNINKLIFDKEK